MFAGRVVLVAINVRHGGQLAHKKMQQRSFYRRGCRSRNLRYRTPRLDHRTRPKGWPPVSPTSRHHFVDGHPTPPVGAGDDCPPRAGLVRQGEDGEPGDNWCGVSARLARRRRGEYLLAKWGWTWAHCRETGVVLNIDHICYKASGGANRGSNLACVPSYQSRGKDELKARGASAFGPGEAGVIAKRVFAHAKAPRKDADGVNTTRWALYRALRATELTIATAAGGYAGAPSGTEPDAVCPRPTSSTPYASATDPGWRSLRP